MKRVLLILISIFCCASLFAQEKDFTAFIPKDYDTLFGGIAVGDLNKDGIDDLAFALYNKLEKKQNREEQSEDSLRRLLVILFGTKSGYKPVAKSSTAILCKSCGGIFGDPFSGIEISKGVLKIYHFGGSNWKWTYTHKFRFQNNDWYLIGRKSRSYWAIEYCDKLDDFAGLNAEDINFVTGQYETKKISEDCRLLENKKGRKKILPLVSLTKFTIEN